MSDLAKCFSTCSVFLLLITPARADAVDPKEAVETILQHVHENYARIKSARGEMHYARQNSLELQRIMAETLAAEAIRDAKEQVGAAPKQTEKIRLSPLRDQDQQVVQSVTILGRDIRIDGGIVDPNSVFILNGQERLHYNPLNNQVYLAAGGRNWPEFRGPRDVFVYSALSLKDALQEADNIAAVSISSDRGQLLRLSYAGEKRRTTIDFDPATAYLPVFVAEGNITNEITYQQLKVAGGEVWFPKRFVIKFWLPENSVTEPSEEGWNQQMTYTLRDFQLNVEVSPDEFAVEVPVGALVSDEINRTAYRVNAKTRMP